MIASPIALDDGFAPGTLLHIGCFIDDFHEFDRVFVLCAFTAGMPFLATARADFERAFFAYGIFAASTAFVTVDFGSWDPGAASTLGFHRAVEAIFVFGAVFEEGGVPGCFLGVFEEFLGVVEGDDLFAAFGGHLGFVFDGGFEDGADAVLTPIVFAGERWAF